MLVIGPPEQCFHASDIPRLESLARQTSKVMPTFSCFLNLPLRPRREHQFFQRLRRQHSSRTRVRCTFGCRIDAKRTDARQLLPYEESGRMLAIATISGKSAEVSTNCVRQGLIRSIARLLIGRTEVVADAMVECTLVLQG